MTWWTLLRRTWGFYWRSNAAAAAGVAVATAVITGALLVGDSLRGSLRAVVWDRLGPVDALLRTERFFQEKLAREIQTAVQSHPRAAETGLRDFVPVLLLEAAVEAAGSTGRKSVGGVQVIGCDERFWQLDSPKDPSERLSPDKAGEETNSAPSLPGDPQASEEEPAVVLNETLADFLGVRPGEEILIRFFHAGRIAPESALGRKHDTVRTWRVVVGGLAGSRRWAGRFAWTRFHQKPLSVYAPLRHLQRLFQQPGRVNAILAIGQWASWAPPEAQQAVLAECLRPTAEDYGIRIEQVGQGEYTYIHITTDRLLFEPALEAAVHRILQRQRYQPVLTYLANTIQRAPPTEPPITQQADDGRIVPYSTVTATDFEPTPPWGPFRTVDGRRLEPLQDEPEPEIVLNRWAAESLGLKLPTAASQTQDPASQPDASPLSPSASEQPAGKEKKEQNAPATSLPRYVYLSFFEPESVEGRTVQRTVRFRLAGVVSMEGPARDRRLTPDVPGLTDRRSIRDWEVPFRPFYEGLIRRADEEYFRKEGLLPKAFVSLATGQRLWGSRFGRVSSFRVVPSQTATVESLRRQIQQTVNPAELGWQFQPVKRQGLAASQGSSSFEMLFLGFSVFLIFSAAMLAALLARLAVDARQESLGLLLAVGFTPRRIQGLLLAEGALAAGVGSGMGMLAGWVYAAGVLAGFRTWAAQSLPVEFLQLHGRPESFGIGGCVGFLVGMTSMAWAVGRAAQASPIHLLSNLPAEEPPPALDRPHLAKSRQKIAWWVGGSIAAAGALSLFGGIGLAGDEMAQAGAFFGAGALMLTASLLWIRNRFRPPAGAISSKALTGRWALVRLAFRSASRNPRRSCLTVGLMAAAVFLIAATSVFRLELPGPIPHRYDGTGGLLFWGETTLPIFHSLSQADSRADLPGWREEYEQIFQNTKVHVFSVRVRTGEDASCRNLYRSTAPRILGLPKEFLDRPAFAWQAALTETAEEKANPWLVLARPIQQDADGALVAPAILDADTAAYSLKVGLGQQVQIRTDEGQTVRFRILGLLRRSVFQGDLLISEGHFVRLFPAAAGYRLFLTAVGADLPIDEHKSIQQTIQQVWRQTLADYGLQMQSSPERLAGFFAVQNTYLAAFQSLGGLGLLLGSLGLGVVQVRHVLQRRRELALLAAVGFAPARLAAMILWETWLLLGLGLGSGVMATAVAVWPHWILAHRSLPWTMLAGGFGSVVAVGTLAGLAAVRAVVRLPILQLLRQE